jgi:hypothetical protein
MTGRSLFIVIVQTNYGLIVMVWIIATLLNWHKPDGSRQHGGLV